MFPILEQILTFNKLYT